MRFSTAVCTLSAFAPGDWNTAMPAAGRSLTLKICP